MKANAKKMTIQLASLEKQLQQKVTVDHKPVFFIIFIRCFFLGAREERTNTDM